MTEETPIRDKNEGWNNDISEYSGHTASDSADAETQGTYALDPGGDGAIVATRCGLYHEDIAAEMVATESDVIDLDKSPTATTDGGTNLVSTEPCPICGDHYREDDSGAKAVDGAEIDTDSLKRVCVVTGENGEPVVYKHPARWKSTGP